MKIATIGKGNVGGGLANLWRNAGHDVDENGKEGGDVSDADGVVVDATNHFQGERPDFPSLAHQVKSITGGPVAKAFNLNFASAYDRVAGQEPRPGNLYCADAEAREV